ncbi:hypothetical protein [Enterococcus sp.]|uniref:hypothetical protein n=1 Tax=Enterococcus sp. TaxID=35783 RepID=UPI00289D5563|nr:hypothetical protein [Enterococcus sp.]
MSNKLLISLSDRNLLLFSDFVKNTEPEIYKILEENKTISTNFAKQLNIFEKIKQSLPFWIEFSRKEWVSDKQNPRLVAKDGNFKKCQLCNTANKFQYKIENKSNGNTLLIGGNCVNYFKELRTMKKLISNDEEYNRYQKLLSYDSYFYDVLVTNTDIINSTEIILPNYYKDSFKKSQKRLTQKLRKYIKHGEEFGEKEIHHLILVYKNEIQKIDEFINKNKNNNDYLSRDMAGRIKKNQKNDFEKILSAVENNGGKISKSTSLLIKIEPYLELIASKIKYRLPKGYDIIGTKFGAFNIEISNENLNYEFEVDSKLIMTEYFKNRIKSIPTFFLNNLNILIINEASTRDKLVQKGQRKMLEVMDGEIYEANIKRIIQVYDNDLTSKEYNETYSKVEAIINRLFIFKKSHEDILYVSPVNDLIPIGKKSLFTDDEIDSTDLDFRDISIKDFQQFVASQIV